MGSPTTGNSVRCSISAYQRGAQWLAAIWGILPQAFFARLRPRADMLISYGNSYYTINSLVTFDDFHTNTLPKKVKYVILS